MSGREESTARPGQSLVTAAAVGAFAAFLVAFWIPLLQGSVYFAIDVVLSYYPTLHFYDQALATGESFLWMPTVFGGCYLHGIGQAAMTHPVVLLAYGLLPWRWAFALAYPLSYPVLFAGVYVLLRRFSLPRAAAACGGLACALSGFALMHWMHQPAVAVMAHTPWILALTHAVLERPSARRAAAGLLGIALLTGSQALLGYPQFVYFSCLAEVVFLAALAGRWRTFWRAGAVWGAAKALAVLIGAVQLLPTWDVLMQSERALPTEAFRTSFSMPPWMLLQVFNPFLYDRAALGYGAHEFGIYTGVVTLALCVWAVTSRGAPVRLRWWAMAAALLCVVLALGRYGGLYTLMSHLPVLGKFRSPARHISVAHLAMAVLAALAVADLLRGWTAPRRRAALAALVALAAAGWVVALGALAVRATQPLWAADIPLSGAVKILAGAVLLTGACLTVAGAARWPRVLLPAVVVLAALDQGYYGLRYVWFEDPVDPLALAGAFPEPPGPGRIGNGDGRALMPATMRGHTVIGGYVALAPGRMLDYTDPRALRLAGVRWFHTAPPNLLPPEGWAAGEWRDLGEPMARARLVTRAELSSDPMTALADIDPAVTALVAEPLTLEPGPPGAASVTEDRPGRITVETRAPGRQLLVLTESHHPGWRAEASGGPLTVTPVYGDLLGCVVPAGAHRVTLVFDPPSWRWGLRLTLLGLALTFAASSALWLAGRTRAEA